jgi:hypothetical protein
MLDILYSLKASSNLISGYLEVLHLSDCIYHHHPSIRISKTDVSACENILAREIVKQIHKLRLSSKSTFPFPGLSKYI